jgi:hypothetical protein
MELSLTPRQTLEQAICADPRGVKNYVEFANLLTEQEQFQEAEVILMRGMANCGELPELKDCLRHVQRLHSQRDEEVADARRKEIGSHNRPLRMLWLETVLALAAIALILQFVPSVATAIWKALDFRQWSHTTWVVAIIVVLAVLGAVHIALTNYTPTRSGSRRRAVRSASRKNG